MNLFSIIFATSNFVFSVPITTNGIIGTNGYSRPYNYNRPYVARPAGYMYVNTGVRNRYGGK